MNPEINPLLLAREFVDDPANRLQVKVELADKGYVLVSDMIDEAVKVSQAYIKLQRVLSALKELVACKALKEAAELCMQNGDYSAELFMARYEQRKEPAWKEAIEALREIGELPNG